MTEKQPTFSHITVHADEDDDFVIQAGAKPSTDEPVVEEVHVEDVVASDGEEQPTDKHAASPARIKQDIDDGYHETTLEDLQSTPIKKKKKVVIALALILLAFAIVYCVFFMN